VRRLARSTFVVYSGRLCQKFAEKKAEAESHFVYFNMLNRNMLRKVAVNMACAA
jgi:hypothetical protein